MEGEVAEGRLAQRFLPCHMTLGTALLQGVTPYRRARKLPPPSLPIQGYITHKNPPPLGLYRRPMPTVLLGVEVEGEVAEGRLAQRLLPCLGSDSLQGYLAHKNTPKPPKTPLRP